MEPLAFRKALGSFATCVTIITTIGLDAADIGVTANSFNSASRDPPMVLWSLARTSGSLAAFEAAGYSQSISWPPARRRSPIASPAAGSTSSMA